MKPFTQVMLMPHRYRVWCDKCNRHVATDLKVGEARAAEAEHIRGHQQGILFGESA